MRHSNRSVWNGVVAGLVLAVLNVGAPAQQPPVNGMRPAELRTHAITDATVVIRPGETIENATIVIRDGLIRAVGQDVEIPASARRWSGEGLTVYPGLIESALLVDPGEFPDSNGSHWNPQVHPQVSLVEHEAPSKSVRQRLRAMGFTTAAVYPEDGMFRGTGAVVSLGDEKDEVLAYRQRAHMAMGFDRGGGGWSNPIYPGSLMGSIAMIRQTLLDARWHDERLRVWRTHPDANEPPEQADALVALKDVIHGRQGVLFDVSNEKDALRAAKIADAFALDMTLLGSGYEFRRLDEIVDTNMPIVVPLDFPDRPDVSTLAEAEHVSLREMMTWEQAPTNVRRLLDAGATVALTTHRLDRRKTFFKSLRSAIKHGLHEDDALAALTTTPAKLLGIDHLVGTIEPGKTANLVVLEGKLFDNKPTIRDVWVNGKRYEYESDPLVKLIATGALTTDRGETFTVAIDTTKKSVTFTLEQDDAPPAEVDHEAADDDKKATGNKEKKKPGTIKAKKVIVQQDQISFVIDGRPFEVEGYVRFSGVLSAGTITGRAALPDGETFTFEFEPSEESVASDAPQVVEGEGDASDEQPNESSEQDDTVSGEWSVALASDQMPREIPGMLDLRLGDDGTLTGSIAIMGRDVELNNGQYDASTGEVRFSYTDPQGNNGRLVAQITGRSLSGQVSSSMGTMQISGSNSSAGDGNGEREVAEMPPDELLVPLGAYGRAEAPQQQDVLVRGATIWTAGPDGIIEEGDLYIQDGKVTYVGPMKSWAWGASQAQRGEADDDARRAITAEQLQDNARAADAPRVINARGKHVTPGLIDCHSHTGIDGGVNEFAQTNTAEVRIEDVIDPDDINWYRQLAGGLTACNQLHGSANPIGGQNSIVKLKWGKSAQQFLIPDAAPGIKFALGENVKRSSGRYPNTRMGVETFIRDAFVAARQYRAKWDRYNALPTEQRNRTMPPRRDLEMETLVQILEGDRDIHCHSYRQDEILALMRIAEDFGFTIGTFQHILEGYKVADEMVKHGAHGSAFSDWWAYKVEVIDAIPYAGALMTQVGVNVSFNSDSSELARRMNTEAAKAVRYGGLEPHEALKLVTINPAIQMGIEHRTGSLEKGKDGDFVIWSASPLSTYARCEQTWIEGARYFSLEEDQKLRQRTEAERQRLIQKILRQAHGEAPQLAEADDDEAPETEKQSQPGALSWQDQLVEQLLDDRRQWMEQQVRLGHDPEHIHPGRCACNDVWWMLQHK